MSRIFQPLLFLLAHCTRNELIRQIEVLKAENQMLRQRVPKKRVFLSGDEKTKLIDLGQPIGPALKHLLTIVSYRNNDLCYLKLPQSTMAATVTRASRG